MTKLLSFFLPTPFSLYQFTPSPPLPLSVFLTFSAGVLSVFALYIRSRFLLYNL